MHFKNNTRIMRLQRWSVHYWNCLCQPYVFELSYIFSKNRVISQCLLLHQRKRRYHSFLPKYTLDASQRPRWSDYHTEGVWWLIIKVISLTSSLPPPPPPLRFLWPLTGYDRQYSRLHKMLSCAVLWLRDVKPLLLRQQHKGKRPSH